eukprot:1064232-Pyramimonas_sp.AAC.1
MTSDQPKATPHKVGLELQRSFGEVRIPARAAMQRQATIASSSVGAYHPTLHAMAATAGRRETTDVTSLREARAIARPLLPAPAL